MSIQRIKSFRYSNYQFNWRRQYANLWKMTAYYLGKRMRAEGYVHVTIHHAELIYAGINNALYVQISTEESRRHLVEDLLVALHQRRLDKQV